MSTKPRKKKKSGDILESLSKKLKRQIKSKEQVRRIRMHDSRERSMRYGNGKIPAWTEINWSPAKAPIILARAWWRIYAIPTRVRTKILKSGKKRYYLDIYNHTARKFEGKKKR